MNRLNDQDKTRMTVGTAIWDYIKSSNKVFDDARKELLRGLDKTNDNKEKERIIEALRKLDALEQGGTD